MTVTKPLRWFLQVLVFIFIIVGAMKFQTSPLEAGFYIAIAAALWFASRRKTAK